MIASKDILKLQSVQNCLSTIVTPSPRFSHSVPLLFTGSRFNLATFSNPSSEHSVLQVSPTLWNSLSEHVKSSNRIVLFRHHLKTHLFRLVYPFKIYLPSDPCCRTLHCTHTMSLANPCTRYLTDLDSFECIGAIEVVLILILLLLLLLSHQC